MDGKIVTFSWHPQINPNAGIEYKFLNGTYRNKLASGGVGVGARFNITVSGGVITSITLANAGCNYRVNDTLTVSFGGGKVYVRPSQVTGPIEYFSYTDLQPGSNTTGTYNNVTLTGGTGSGAAVNVIVEDGYITSVVGANNGIAGGSGYTPEDILSVSNEDISLRLNTGSSFYGPVAAFTITDNDPGNNTNGTYTNQPATGGNGSGAKFDVVVSGGNIVKVEVANPGTGYKSGDVLAVTDGNIDLDVNVSIAGEGGVAVFTYSDSGGLVDGTHKGVVAEGGAGYGAVFDVVVDQGKAVSVTLSPTTGIIGGSAGRGVGYEDGDELTLSVPGGDITVPVHAVVGGDLVMPGMIGPANYITTVQCSVPNTVTYFSTDVTVPSISPETSQNTNFIFWPGIQDTEGMLLQPILRLMGGKYYQIYSEVISPSGGDRHSSRTIVVPGQRLRALIVGDEKTGIYTVEWEGFPSTKLICDGVTVNDISPDTVMGGNPVIPKPTTFSTPELVLETNSQLNSCSDLGGDCVFSNITIKTTGGVYPTLNWVGRSFGPCNNSYIIGSNSNPGGNVTLTTGRSLAPSPVTATLSAAQNTIAPGGSTTLTWSTTGAAHATGLGFNTSDALFGSVTVSPAQTTEYTLVADDAGYTHSSTAKVTVTVQGHPVTVTPPTGSITVTPNLIVPGASATLTWSSSDATTLTSQGFSTTALSGSITVAPTETTTYSINLTGSGGTVSYSVTLNVSTPAPIVTPTGTVTQVHETYYDPNTLKYDGDFYPVAVVGGHGSNLYLRIVIQGGKPVLVQPYFAGTGYLVDDRVYVSTYWCLMEVRVDAVV